jgi:hypothetical protein
VRVVTIIQSDLSKIISRGFRCDGIVPFPSRDGERNDTARMVNASFACASGEPLLAAHATIAVWPKGVNHRRSGTKRQRPRGVLTLPKERVSELLPDRWTPPMAADARCASLGSSGPA